MKTISVRQPWAWALFHGKDIENRPWATHYTGPLLIHASKTFDYDGLKWIQKNFPITIAPFIPGTDFLSFGAIIGKVRMTDCIIHSSSPWFFGPYGFLFTDPVEFKTPIPYRGRLKFFDVPDELIKELL